MRNLWSAAAAALVMGLAPVAQAQKAPQPKVPLILGGDATLDPCSVGMVAGLRGPRSVLAVHTAPRDDADTLDQLGRGRTLFVCADRGEWLGVIYGSPDQDCGVGTPWPQHKRYTGPCASGWVHRRWVRIIAG